MGWLPVQQRELHASVGEEGDAAELPGLFGGGQALEDHVPEQQLEQQRDIAQGFDVKCGDLRQQPVFRQAADADQGAEDGGQDDADDGDFQRVQDTDQ